MVRHAPSKVRNPWLALTRRLIARWSCSRLLSVLRGKRDAFVLKINPAGKLDYSSYLGGSGDADNGRGIAVDSSGNVYVTGDSDSLDFPTANPLQSVAGGGTCGTGTF